VVDDHETSRRLLVQLADRWEMPVTAVSDAAGALTCLREAAAREQPFDCAALTMQMPDLGGIELAALIRLDRTFPTPALVMLTGTSDQRRLAREAGIEIHLTKPVRRSRFTSALTAALGIRDRRDELAAVPELSACEVGAPLVLVAEDNELNQILAVRMLERRGYRTEVADNGRQALAMLERQRYAAVLMDCQMPELSGYDTTQQLRQREQGRAGTPVIAMTAGVLRGDREQCLASGMDDYLTKPIKPAELDRLLRRWAPKIGQHCPSPRSREWNWPGLDRSDVDRDLPT
jgi:CheY-like chemotaxis protein